MTMRVNSKVIRTRRIMVEVNVAQWIKWMGQTAEIKAV